MVNKVFLIGRLGKDPVVKHFQNGGAIAEFSLATTESYKDKDGNWKEITDWHNVKINNKFAVERAEKNLKKGSQVFVEGKIRTREYDDKDGVKRRVTEIIVETFRMLDKKDSSSGDGSSYTPSYAPASEENTSSSPAADDDLPF
ncbi:MAG: single-stranded DNA-binding protein [Chitinophagales bacterium]